MNVQYPASRFRRTVCATNLKVSPTPGKRRYRPSEMVQNHLSGLQTYQALGPRDEVGF
jgi:hypothetical protein